MIVPQYTPGEWFAIVTDGTVALLPPTTEVAVVAEVWESLRDGGSLTEQVQVLLRAGIASVPPFALVSLHGGEVQAIVRGRLEVEVLTAEGIKVLSGARVSTWAEDTVDDVVSVCVRVLPEPSDGSSPAAGRPTSGTLPVLSAVVRAAEVRVELAATDADWSDVAAVGGFGSMAEPEPAVTSPAPVAPGPAAPRGWVENGVDQKPAEAVPAPEPGRDPREPVPAMAVAVPADVGEQTGPGEDHDGMTVLSSDVVALRRQLPDWAGDAVPGPLAVPAPLTPPPAKLLLSSGLVVSLNRPVLLGRAPQVSRVSNRELPRLVTVASPNQDISRTHAEVRMDGEDVLVTDLRSTNGVLVLRQGAGPQRLHPGEPTVVEPGVVVDLGEGVTFTVERGA